MNDESNKAGVVLLSETADELQSLLQEAFKTHAEGQLLGITRVAILIARQACDKNQLEVFLTHVVDCAFDCLERNGSLGALISRTIN